MSVPASLLPELEEVVQHGSAEKRAETLRRITSLFLDGAGAFNDEHVALFDDVIGCLIEEIEVKALAELARRLAPVPNAPAGVVVTLAKNDDIAVAGPVLKQARLDDPDLKYIAETKSQAHLLALSTRLGISEALVGGSRARGNGEVARSVATNQQGAACRRMRSPLWSSAPSGDGVLAEKVGLRTDIPPRLFRQLLMQASDVVQKRLLAQAKPETQAEIRRVLAKVTDEVAAKAAPRNYTAALAAVQRAAQGAQAHRGRHRRICQDRQIRRDHRRAGHDLRGAGRGGGPADQRRARRSGADPGARGRLRLADGARDHQRAARRQALEPDARCRAREFRAADRRHRAARGAVLAGAAGQRRVIKLCRKMK